MTRAEAARLYRERAAATRRATLADQQSALRSVAECERSLYTFLQRSWPNFDPAPFVGGWHLEAIAEHLQAVTDGQIRRLLINIRPRSSKTSLVSIAWPVWTWALAPDPRYLLRGPQVRFLCGSYGANKAKEDGVTARRLIGSEWYQRRWGARVRIVKDRDNQERYDNSAGGSRISTGIPESLGKGGMIRILDDPQKTDEVESDLVREATIRAYREIWATRENDPNAGAEVMIMQRQHELDLSGYWLEHYPDLVHLCIPAWYEADRHCATYVNGVEFWSDPREIDGESFWLQRYGETQRAKDAALGPYAMAGQIQQRPEPRGGGIVKREWWRVWPPEDQAERWIVDGRLTYPPFEFVLGYLDTAFTTKEENDYCAMTRWGVFADDVGRPRVMLAGAWHARLDLRALSLRVLNTCRRGKIDCLVIENKAGGIWVSQELARLMRPGEFITVLDEPRGDKSARLHAVVPAFVDGLVHAPDTKWADMVIDEVSRFPRGRWRDLTDTVSGAIGYLRRNDLIRLPAEHDADAHANQLWRGQRESVAGLYEVG